MPAAWSELNEAVGQFNPKRLAGHQKVEVTYAMAHAVQRIRNLLTADVMDPIMGLMNTESGFLTDRGPHIRVKNNDDNWKKTPYDQSTVRNVLIDALLSGIWPIGNHFNIISGRLYITQTGYLYRVKNIVGLTDLKVDLQPPMQCPGGASVLALCTWKLNGVLDECSQKFQMRTYGNTSTEQLVGKAHRKVLRAAYQQIAGGTLMGVMPDDQDLMPEAETPPAAITSKPPPPQFQDAESSRSVSLEKLIDEYATAWELDMGKSCEVIRAYVKKTFNFPSLVPCTQGDFEEMRRRLRLGPFDKEALPSPDDILKDE